MSSTGAAKRRFGGTVAQIRAALAFYKVFAYTTGVLLLLLVIELVIRYGFQSVLMVGGNDASTGQAHGFGFASVAQDGSFSVTGGFNLSTAVLIVHGWM